jgi:hypothetical protein
MRVEELKNNLTGEWKVTGVDPFFPSEDGLHDDGVQIEMAQRWGRPFLRLGLVSYCSPI